MQRPSNRSVFRFLFGAYLLLAPLNFLVFAEWYKDYDAGLKAIHKGDWSEAISKLQSAMREQNTEKVGVRFYGTRLDDYFPHYYLGLAYYNNKNFSAAADEFRLSEQQSAIKERPRLLSQLKNLQTLARAQLVTGVVTTPAGPVIPSPEPGREEVRQVQPSAPEPQRKVETPAAQPRVDVFKIAMRSAARKYFQGNFDSAIRLLLSAANSNPNEAAPYFLLGCSYASKYLLSGSNDPTLLQRAVKAFQKCRQLNPEYAAMNKSYISPAVLEIYEKSSS